MNVKHKNVSEKTLNQFEKFEKKLKRTKLHQNMIFFILFAVTFVSSIFFGEVDMANLASGIPNLTKYVSDIMPEITLSNFWGDIANWYWRIDSWLLLLWDTIIIAFLGTLFGLVGAFIISFFASANLNKNIVTYNLARRYLEICRSVPEIVYALIFIFAFFQGPLPGVLAIAIHSTGSLGKLFSEINENINMKEVEGVRSSGGSWTQLIRYAVIPQVMPNFLSYSLLRFEINVRAASIIGYVGAGGIGQELQLVIKSYYFNDISAIILLIILTVVIIDLVCEKIREKFIGKEVAI